MEEDDNRQVNSVRPAPLPIFIPHLLNTSGSQFLLPTLRWTAKRGSWPTGDPDLQHYVGELLYKGEVGLGFQKKGGA